ncbi:MAG TPA: MarC family protein [Candidatus Methylomirabilis sp.]|nr:MarC family protein [Candidatus Methylomirabilis sp.]
MRGAAVLDLFLNSLIVMLVVVDPVGLAPIFASLTYGESPTGQRRAAVRGTLIAGAILVAFVLAGDTLLNILGIGMPAFQIAGGILLFLLAVDMVFARHSGLRSTTEREQREAETKKDISVFPLAIPLIAGPGALTTVLLMVGDQGDDPMVIGTVLAVVLVVLSLTLVSLLFSVRIMRFMGETGANVVSRVLGVILAALAVQFVLDGWDAGFSYDDTVPQMMTVLMDVSRSQAVAVTGM